MPIFTEIETIKYSCEHAKMVADMNDFVFLLSLICQHLGLCSGHKLSESVMGSDPLI